MLEIQRVCPLCGTMRIIKVPEKGYNEWLNGKRIQDALPNVSLGDREMLMSGICEHCFDRMFADD